MTTYELPQQRVLGVRFHPVSTDAALQTLGCLLEEARFHLVVTLGTEMVMRARGDAGFREVVEQADLVVPDGIGLVLASRYCGLRAPERVPGIDLVVAMCHRLPDLRLFLLGGAAGVAEEAAAGLVRRVPGLTVAGTHHGYFRQDEPVKQAILASGANVLLAGLGSPRQELWMQRHGPDLGLRLGIGVGGSFDVLSGRSRRAPRWMIHWNLEWLYRLVREPARWRRMLALPRFLALVLASGRGAVEEVCPCKP